MEEEENEKRAVRIFVGGLSEAVTAEDIRRLFESLGTIQSLETIRTKGRSLAYLDFLSDPKSLSKLFSKYNGCVWKGGKLRLEKAKEHYLDRLKKEWEQDAMLSTEPPAADLSTHKEDLVKEMPKSRRAADLNEKPLNIFFPRLRSVKSIPFSGTGKHKYSFQNIKVPPMPVHFCDCEEHCSPFVPTREKSSMNREAEIGGINDEEINIMNAVMNKLLEKEKVPATKHLVKKQDAFESRDALHSNALEADSETDDDDDGIIINIATKKNKAALIGSEELERVMENQESRSNKINLDEEEPNKSMLQVQKGSNSNPNKVKKKKPLPKSESKSNEGVSSTPVGKSKMQTLLDDLGSGKQSTEPEYDFGVPAKVSWSQKSSWRELVGKGGNAAFSASLILPKFDSGKDQQNSDGSSTPSCTDDETENVEMPLGKGGNAAFSASLIGPKFDSDKEQQNSDGSLTPSSTDDETENMESDEYLESKPTNAQVIEEPSESLTPSSTDDETENMESDEYLESKPTNTQLIEEPSESLTPSSTDDETENMDSDEYLESKPTNTQVIEEPSESLTPSSTDDETENMESDEYLESKPTNNTQVIEEPSEAQPTNAQAMEEPAEAPPINKQAITEPVETQHNTAPKETGRGSAWLQKQSWTQLVNEKNNSFSISQILPGITFAEQTAKEPILHPADSNDCKHNGADNKTVNRTIIDGFNLRNIVPENSEHVGADGIVSAPVVEKTIETCPREGSSTKVEIGETCSFMRSAASLKDWAKAKAAVSGSLKRKRGEK